MREKNKPQVSISDDYKELFPDGYDFDDEAEFRNVVSLNPDFALATTTLNSQNNVEKRIEQERNKKIEEDALKQSKRAFKIR